MALNDQTKADIKSLVDFSTQVMHQAGTMSQDWAGPISRACSVAAGMSTVTEAVRFGQKLSGCMQALNDFTPDAFKGMTYLGYGTLTIADNYVTGDLSQAQEMSSAAEAFLPPADRSAATEANESEFAAQREAYFHPKTGTVDTELPAADPGQKAPAAPPTPDEVADEHRKKYAQSETWRPEDPNAPVTPDDTYDCSAGCVPGL